VVWAKRPTITTGAVEVAVGSLENSSTRLRGPERKANIEELHCGLI